MQILVQQKESRRYFRDIGEWDLNPRSALNFGTTARAVDFCVANRILGVQLVLKFDESEYDLVLPLTLEADAEVLRLEPSPHDERASR